MTQNKKEFLNFVYLEAMARDIECHTREARTIARMATQIPDENIPPNPVAAALVLVSHAEGNEPPFRWMSTRRLKK